MNLMEKILSKTDLHLNCEKCLAPDRCLRLS